MKRIKDILLLGFLTTCAVGCIDDVEPIQTPEQEMAYINLYITTDTPSPKSITRADEDNGAVKALSPENKIHSVKVWVFGPKSATNEERTLYGYVDDATTHDPTGLVPDPYWKKLSIPVLKGFTEISNNKVNVYTLANAETIGLGEALKDTYNNDVVTEDLLKGLLMKNATKTATTVANAVPATGLPISRIVENVPLMSLMSDQNPLRIVMQRAVTRFRIYAAQPAVAEGQTSSFAINNVKIKGGFVADMQKVFPQVVNYSSEIIKPDGTLISYTDWPGATAAQLETPTASYVTDNIATAVNTTVKGVQDPEYYIFDNADGHFKTGDNANATVQTYSDALETAGLLYNVTYLNETDQNQFTLSVVYTDLDGNTITTPQEFTLGNSGDTFFRNTDVIIYMYYKQGRLEISPYVLPWDYVDANNFTYSTPGASGLQIRNEDGVYRLTKDLTTDNKIDWDKAHAVIVYDADFTGAGQYNPHNNILLQATSEFTEGSMTLQIDNNHFGFTYQKDNAYSDILDVLEINESTSEKNGNKYTTTFYVVPKSTANANEQAHISMIYTKGSVLNKMPFNASVIAGSGDNTEVWIQVVSEADYNDDNKTIPSTYPN